MQLVIEKEEDPKHQKNKKKLIKIKIKKKQGETSKVRVLDDE